MKVLVIAYYFPPQTSVGAFRTTRLLDHFATQGIEAHVLTVRHPSRRFHPYKGDMPAQDVYQGHAVTRTPEWPTQWLWALPTVLGRRVARWLGKNWSDGDIAPRFWYVDIEYGWIPTALRAGTALIKRFKPDVIYVSCPPFSSALIARQLSRASNTPYVLDFRDSWLMSAYSNDYQTRRYQDLEKSLLKDAAALIVTTPSDARAYRQYFQQSLARDSADVSLVYNAFEPAFARSPAALKTDRLTLLYTGAWDTQARSPRKLLECLAEVDFAWKLISVGPNNHLLQSAAAGLQFKQGEIECRDAVPKAQLIPMMDDADALFLIQGEPAPGQPNTHIAAKTFDYLATGSPVLALAAEGDNRELLATQERGIYLAYANDAASIRVTLERLQADWHSGSLVRERRDNFLATFSGSSLSQNTLDILKAATNAT